MADIQDKLAQLTPREGEVLRHVISGRLNKQIAWDLGTVEKTIKVHRSRIMEKMGVRTIADLVRLTEQIGLAPHGSGAQRSRDSQRLLPGFGLCPIVCSGWLARDRRYDVGPAARCAGHPTALHRC